MGISGNDLRLLIKLKMRGLIPSKSAVVEIGAQQLNDDFLCSHAELETIGRLFDVERPCPLPPAMAPPPADGERKPLAASAPWARQFWTWLGLDYASIDIDGSPGSIPLDLNYHSIPADIAGKFHLVTNYGTTEHIANQLNAFKVIHDLTSEGGIMVHCLPAQGMFNHGLMNYNPKFFWMLARSNGYKWRHIDFSCSGSALGLPPNIVKSVTKFAPDFAERARGYGAVDCSIMVGLQKVFDIPFVAPLDMNTGTRTGNADLEQQYWTVFKPGAFKSLAKEGNPKGPLPPEDNIKGSLAQEGNKGSMRGRRMGVFARLKRLIGNSDRSVQLAAELREGIANQSGLLNDKLGELIESTVNQSSGLNDKLEEIIDGTVNQSSRLNDKLKELIEGTVNQSSRLNDYLKELIEGTANQSSLFNDKLRELIEGTLNQSSLINDKLTAMIDRQNAQLELQKAEIAAIRELLVSSGGAGNNFLAIQRAPVRDTAIASTTEPTKVGKTPFETALGGYPLMIGPKTYNTSHPEYDADLVRNFPGKIFNVDKACNNIVYADLKRLAEGERVPDEAWNAVLKDSLEEARTVPHSDQVFERRAYIEKYLEEIAEKYQAHYAAGWVNLDDALFLYWLVRTLRPKTIVQTGVCNGLSSAFMMLGLVKNGPEGRLHAIDLPPVFNSKDAGWTIKGKVYGVVIPEGKSSGWIVPDAYRGRLELWNGDAKALLPKMVDKVDAIDLFYHDSDHTYDHMMFEFREAKRKLRPGGLIVGDDVSWNASVWDFADEHGAPSYNYKGAVGVAFF